MSLTATMGIFSCSHKVRDRVESFSSTFIKRHLAQGKKRGSGGLKPGWV